MPSCRQSALVRVFLTYICPSPQKGENSWLFFVLPHLLLLRVFALGGHHHAACPTELPPWGGGVGTSGRAASSWDSGPSFVGWGCPGPGGQRSLGGAVCILWLSHNFSSAAPLPRPMFSFIQGGGGKNRLWEKLAAASGEHGSVDALSPCTRNRSRIWYSVLPPGEGDLSQTSSSTCCGQSGEPPQSPCAPAHAAGEEWG